MAKSVSSESASNEMRMKRRTSDAFPFLAAAGVVLLICGRTLAAGPTTTDCLNAADTSLDLRAAHKLLEARAQLLVCAAASCPADVRTECLRRIDQVKAAIPTIVFEAKDAAGNDVAAVKVIMDGQPLRGGLDGTAISIDPGKHQFVFEAPGGASVSKELMVHEAEKDRHETIVIVAAPPPELQGPAVPPTPGAETSGQPQPLLGSSRASASPSGPGMRTIAFALGATGIAGLALGSGFGFVALSKTNEEKTCISTPSRCPSSTQSAHDDAVTNATISTFGFVAGGALVAGGVALYFLYPPTPNTPKTAPLRVSPTLGSKSATIELGGRF
jgi:hypothetical protein